MEDRTRHMCDWVKKDGTECGKPTIRQKCSAHLGKRPYAKCVGKCGRSTQSSIGLCAKCTWPQREEEKRQRRELRRELDENRKLEYAEQMVKDGIPHDAIRRYLLTKRSKELAIDKFTAKYDGTKKQDILDQLQVPTPEKIIEKLSLSETPKKSYVD